MPVPRLSKVFGFVVPIVGILMACVSLRADDFTPPSEFVSICASANFDGDMPGQPPHTGGIGQPTQLIVTPGTSALVQMMAYGIGSQPLVLTVNGPSLYVSAGLAFTPVMSEIVRVEATVSFDRLFDGFFLQTGVSLDGAVATRWLTRADGTIADYSGAPLGDYAPNRPFRVRIDVDMLSKTAAGTIDDELDGFANDPIVTGLPFVNPGAFVPQLGALNASLSVFPTDGATGGGVAYDDLVVYCPMPTKIRQTPWGTLKLRYR